MWKFFQEIDRRDRVLSRLGWFQIALLALMLAAMPLDQRTILGLNPWIKPAKFAASIAIYVWTLAWILPYAAGPRWATALVRWGTCIAMVIEILCIGGQSLRGATSHFNDATPFDGAVFSVMGLLILFSTCLDVLLWGLFCRRAVSLPASYLWGIRTGLFGVIVGGGIGFLMVAHRAHSIGGADGGPGLPLVNWSVEFGDLRPAHALALHALQVLPLLGYMVTREFRFSSSQTQLAILAVAVLLYAALTGFTLWQAIAGQPLMGHLFSASVPA